MNKDICNLYCILGRETKGKWKNYQASVLKFSASYNLNTVINIDLNVVYTVNSVASIRLCYKYQAKHW